VGTGVVGDGVVGTGAAVGAGEGGARSALTSAGNASRTRTYAASPGHWVRDMSRCPAMVGAVTVAPAGQRFEPRDTNVVVVPGAVSTP
jgi:hypothetical protein